MLAASGAVSAVIGALVMQRAGPLPLWAAMLVLVVLVGMIAWIAFDFCRGKLKWPK